MFRTHQARLPHELALMGITDMAAANRYLRERYMPAFNAEFMQPAMEEGSAFVVWIGGELDDILCEQHERVVGKDNCVSFEGMKLQIPADRHRLHYVKVKVAGASLPGRTPGGLSWPALLGALRLRWSAAKTRITGRRLRSAAVQ